MLQWGSRPVNQDVAFLGAIVGGLRTRRTDDKAGAKNRSGLQELAPYSLNPWGTEDSSVKHDRVPGRARGPDDLQRRPDERALVDLRVDQRLGVDVLEVPDSAAGLVAAVAGHGVLVALLAEGLRIVRRRVAHLQRDVARREVLAGAQAEPRLAFRPDRARGGALLRSH